MNRVYFYAGVIVALIAAGIGLGYYWFRPEPPKPETYAPAAVQEDGSLVVERKPQANARPKAQIPKDAKVERIVRFEVKPLELPPQASLDGAGALETSCPSLDMELTLVELPDETRRVILRSERGEVLNAIDIPVKSAKEYKEPKWILGAGKNLFGEGWMVKGSRRVYGPVFLGPQYIQRGKISELWGMAEITFN